MAVRYPEKTAAPGSGPAIVGMPTDDARGPGPEVMAASTLAGDDVVNRQGQDLGKIKEIMIDVPSGHIAYVVLSSGGLLGVGDKLFAIPWQALTLDINRKCFILDVDVKRLKQAPGFDKAHWPAIADSAWLSEAHADDGPSAKM